MEIKYRENERTENRQTHNGRFGTMAAVARRQYCAKLHVIIPQQVQWKSPLRQAAGTLGAMPESAVVKSLKF